MIPRLALRTLTAHPIRSAVLALGFGVGVSVMVILLGVAEVVLEQAKAPALAGGGDIIVQGPGLQRLEAARLVLAGPLAREPLASAVTAASPLSRAELYLVEPAGRTTPVKAQGGIPSLERRLGDQEVAGAAAWTDTEADRPWAVRDPGDALRAIDAFHEIPDVPARAASWAEWLYFNGRSEHVRFYLTFLVGPRLPDGRRAAGVRLQLERDGRMEAYAAGASLDDAAVAAAPDLTIGRNRVRLRGLRYQIQLDLTSAQGTRLTGDLVVDGLAGRQLPPIEMAGAGGWRSGYVVPVMSGRSRGTLTAGGQRVTFDGSGYHDHNWGFWEGVSWQWGQVQQGDLSFVYGRVFPPADAADPARVPGFLGVIGPDGPMGYATGVTITETDTPATGTPSRIVIEGRSSTLAMRLDLAVDSLERNRLSGPMSTPLTFLQMRGRYTVTGEVGGRAISFTAPGSAETFRGAP